jgi:hypothetical protein
MELKPEALSAAFFEVQRKQLVIFKHRITPEMNSEEIYLVANELAEAKAQKEGSSAKQHLNGQLWYVDNLAELSAFTIQQHLKNVYVSKFQEQASEIEMEEFNRNECIPDYKTVFMTEAERIVDSFALILEREAEKEKENRLHLEDLFILGKQLRVVDLGYPHKISERSSNGDRLLRLLKSNANAISEKECEHNPNKFHNQGFSVNSLYEYKGLLLTVEASSRRDGSQAIYEFTCSE